MDTSTKVVHKFEIKMHQFNREKLKKRENEKIYFTIYLQDISIIGEFCIRFDGLFLYAFFANYEGDELMAKYVFWDTKDRDSTETKHSLMLKNETHGIKVFSFDRALENETLSISGKMCYRLMYKNSEALSTMVSIHHNYFNSSQLSDFEIICADKVSLPAHRLILAAGSSFFKDLFDKHRTPPKKFATDFNSNVMLEALRFIYQKDAQNLVELAQNVYLCADKFKLPQLKDICVKSMIENLSLDNVIDRFNFAEAFNEDYLLQMCGKLIKANYLKFRKDDMWEKFSKEQVLIILDIMEKNTKNLHYYEVTL